MAAPIAAEFLDRINRARMDKSSLPSIHRDHANSLIKPSEARRAIEQWQLGETARLKLLIFNGLDPDPEPDRSTDLPRWITWRAAKSRERGRLANEMWTEIQGFDDRLIGALAAAGILIDASHTAMDRLRCMFCEASLAVFDGTHPSITGEDEEFFEEAPEAETKTVVPLMDVFADYVGERKPAPSTVKRWRPVIRALIAQLGHDDASRITTADLIAWKDRLLKQPGGRGVPMAARTVREIHLAAVKVVLGWAVENGRIPLNPAAGVNVRVPKATRLRAKEFNDDEARKILQAALAAGQGRISAQHMLARRWVPWLCAYTGARVGEITQMRGQDVSQRDGVWTIRITPEAGTVKTGAARIVPIHDHLIEMGFLKIARASEGPLFYDPRKGRGGSAGNPQSKKVAERIGAWVRKLGVSDSSIQPNHAWRHLFKSISRRAGMSTQACDVIQGHAARTEGEAYGEWRADVLAIEMSKFPRFHWEMPDADRAGLE
ncbi:tyrosine-type recombinase/integrase [Sphingomonas sp. YR710]|uniref:tyrosine-type recombinase/integrase n=1 Tax=Sphingomonas sp. YR710 TaxID=1882773 RepID=UPI0015A22889|nr:tyrosine-type recombinase/integrase [Sphingomonas sp. YR710]